MLWWGLPKEQEKLWMRDAGDLVEVSSGAGEAVDEDAGALVGVASGPGEAVEDDTGALVGVAS